MRGGADRFRGFLYAFFLIPGFVRGQQSMLFLEFQYAQDSCVHRFLRGRGMDIKPRGSNYETMSVEELMRTKETIEDLIAEKEMQEQSITVEAGNPEPAEA